MTDEAEPAPTRTEELREMATAYLRHEDIATYCTDLGRVRALAAALGNEETLNAFATLVKAVYRGGGMVRPSKEDLTDFLADLKRAVKRVFASRSRTPGIASIANTQEMVDSNSPRMVISGLLLRQFRGRIWYDVFLNKIMTNWKCERDDAVIEPYILGEREMLKIMYWAMSIDIETLATVSMTTVQEAVSFIAYADERDSLVDHVSGLPQWDGIERLDTLMVQGFGAEIDEESGQSVAYLKAIGRNWPISLIVRAKEPGSKVDFMPIFMGPQGALKSTAMKVFGGPFFREIHDSPHHNDFYLSIQGCWVAEVAELASIASSRVENVKVKAALSRQVDIIRPPYAKIHREYQRRTVFAGTSNPGGVGVLRDDTGNRRYGPVTCGVINIDWLTENRDQILAEAARAYEQGARWWEFPKDAHKRATDRYQQKSVHEETIRDHLLSSALFDGTTGILSPALEPPNTHADINSPARWGNVVSPLRVIIQWLGMTSKDAAKLFYEVSGALTRLGWREKDTSVWINGKKKSVRAWIVIDQTSRYMDRTTGSLVDGVSYNRADDRDAPF